jgi:ATP-dependent helicase/nuclease subunit A
MDAATRTLLAAHDAERRIEDANLLYVALTRARQYLFISGSRPDRGYADSWYALISDALADWPRNAQGQPIRRSGTPPATGPHTVEAAPAPDVDARLAQPLAITPAVTRIAPSRQAHTPAGTTGDPDGRERGIAIHTLLDHLSRLPRADTATLHNRMAVLLQRERDDPEFAQWWQHALAVVQDTRLAALFEPGRFTRAWNEVPVQYLEDERLVHGVIDRVVLAGERVTLVDYKSHVHATPGTLDELVDHYRPQIQCYAQAAQRLWPGHRVDACLLFTACRELVGVNGLQSGA